ncbi:MAG: hypothetical protein AVDCRST_MAG51-3298 [uncultured Ramlibacter sp.]|uniref:Uncharacterized protein n=1 Tax=uncultured Ramlibacter sp. TaxID=260755 RepID=A0A6J4QCE1_9BURK|nr:MAG: hypothetical protein AVDCRST_MAG51-3298 [uncultured Ramlibacter sp.]
MRSGQLRPCRCGKARAFGDAPRQPPPTRLKPLLGQTMVQPWKANFAVGNNLVARMPMKPRTGKL